MDNIIEVISGIGIIALFYALGSFAFSEADTNYFREDNLTFGTQIKAPHKEEQQQGIKTYRIAIPSNPSI